MELTTIIDGLRERVREVGEPTTAFGEVSVEVPREALLAAMTYLRDEGAFQLLADWSCVDLLGIEPDARRFQVTAHLASVSHPERLRVRVFVPADDAVVPSLTDIWLTANFQEREMWDFFGVRFDGHPDLRRIFMPEEWDGHPQRKDYPLGGINVEYHHGAFIPPPDIRWQPTTTTGYPGRTS
jgi:NADH-quinone oxidoreductase subunit C